MKNRNEIKDLNETYGEILPSQLGKLLKLFSLKEADRFYDLGSGCGSVVKEVFLKTQCQYACGIEIVPHYYQMAMQNKPSPEVDHQGRRLDFLLGSFLETPFLDATAIFINATCFTQPLLFKLGKIINTLPFLRVLIASRMMPEINLPFNRVVNLECSWDTALFYIYR